MFNFDPLMSESTFLPAPVSVSLMTSESFNNSSSHNKVHLAADLKLLIILFNLPQQMFIDTNIYIYININ